MPFGGDFDDLYNNVISCGLKKIGINCVRGDEIYSTKAIIDDITEQIKFADIIIADVSGLNPNVNYELGLAHAMKKEVIIISSNVNDSPFDYRHLRAISYNKSDIHWRSKLQKEIIYTIKKIDKNSIVHAKNNEHKIISNPLANYYRQIQSSFRYLIDKENTIKSDEFGNCSIVQEWIVEAKNDISFLYHKIILDSPSSINIKKIYDPLNGDELKWLVHESNPNSLFYFILLNNVIPSGKIGRIIIEFSVFSYLKELVDKKNTFLFNQSMNKKAVTVKRIKETYIFPNIKKFEKLRFTISSHPNKELINSEVNSKILDNNRVIEIEFNNPNLLGTSFSGTIEI
jgi:hypothetical protein